MRPDPERLPLDALPLSLAEIWAVIHSQKDLNLPAHKVRPGRARTRRRCAAGRCC